MDKKVKAAAFNPLDAWNKRVLYSLYYRAGETLYELYAQAVFSKYPVEAFVETDGRKLFIPGARYTGKPGGY